VTTDGAVNVGPETSTTHDREAFPTLPAPSVARTWNVCEPSPSPLRTAGDEQAAKEPPSSAHESEPSFAPNGMVAVELATVPVGPPVIDTVGEVVSCTTTLNEPLAVFPPASVAVHDTVVVPMPKLDPEAGEHAGTMEVGPSLAVAV
jgi:hypothetical protein